MGTTCDEDNSQDDSGRCTDIAHSSGSALDPNTNTEATDSAHNVPSNTFLSSPDDVSGISPIEFLTLGRSYMGQDRLDQAVDMFSYGIQAMLEELGEEATVHPDLAPYYLDYGNALLRKVEASNDIFKADILKSATAPDQENPLLSLKSSHDSLHPQTESEDDPDVPDEQLAWEIFELARICYAKVLNHFVETKQLPLPDATSASVLFESPCAPHIEAVQNAAFVHVRLGDILVSQNQLSEASAEYSNALDLLTYHHLPYPSHLTATIALGETALFSKNYPRALELFRKALTLVNNQLQAKDGALVPDNKKTYYRNIKDDLDVQVQELTTTISKGDHSLEELSSSHQTTFDRPRLDTKDYPVVDLGVIQGKYKTTQAPKETLYTTKPTLLNEVIPDMS